MPRQIGTLIESNFTKALITEASALAFPKDACTESFDCVHANIGSIERRPSYEYEIDNNLKTLSTSNVAISTYLWKDVAGDGRRSFVVVQVGSNLYFWEASQDQSLSSKYINSPIDVSYYGTGGEDVSLSECQFAAGNGKLFVFHPFADSFYCYYDEDTRTILSQKIIIEIRDFEGLDDGYPVDFRPTTSLSGLSDAHYYNLLNQGWNVTNLMAWDAATSNMPSNADMMKLFRNSDNEFGMTTASNVNNGNSPAPKGRFILEAFNQDRANVSGIPIPTVNAGNSRPSTGTFFAGRVFYSGVNYTDFNSKIYFSRIVEKDDQYGKCYSINDPTSEDFFDALSTDGGVIDIQDAGTIVKMVPVSAGLAVFASNGIWLISGSTGLGFTANDYSVNKVSSINAVSGSSFVDVAGIPIWWNLDGIYRLGTTQNNGIEVQSLTEQTIKTEYNTIPSSEKKMVKGYYNPITSIVQWLYKTTESSDPTEAYSYDRIMNLNVNTGGFYIWTIPVSNIKIQGLVVLENRFGSDILDDVYDNDNELVYDNDGNVVQVWDVLNSTITPSFKYFTSIDNGSVTFSEARSTRYLDWYSYNNTGVSYTSTFTSGHSLPSKAIFDFNSNYILLYTNSGSVYKVQGLWDFANTGNSGRWSVPQTVDATFEDKQDVVIHRRKIRGHGKSLRIKINSVDGYPFGIVGWGMFVSSNSTL